MKGIAEKSEVMEDEVISLIVPIYNVVNELDRCIKSILKQSYHNLEVFLVDDGSTDGSGAKCDLYSTLDDRITVVHQENKGLSASRNVGVDLCHGKYVCFVDSDDELREDYVEKLYHGIKSTGALLGICGCKHISNTSKKEKMYSPILSTHLNVISAEEYVRLFLDRKIILVTAWSRIYTRTILIDIPFPEGRVYEDYSVHVRHAIKAGRIAIINEALYLYYSDRLDSITNSYTIKGCKDALKAADIVYQDIIAFVPEWTQAATSVYVENLIDIEEMYLKIESVTGEDTKWGETIHYEIKRYICKGDIRAVRPLLKVVAHKLKKNRIRGRV